MRGAGLLLSWTAPPGITPAAVIGDPARHSLSPAIHNAAFAALELPWTFVATDVAAGHAAEAIVAMRRDGLGGMSVTMPHKSDVAALVDERSAMVDALGAANCLVPLGDGRIRAENTDGAGFVNGLADDAGLTPAGRTFVVLGAGGAARAVIAALADAGAASVIVINRSVERAVHAVEVSAGVGTIGTVDDVGDVDVVINATPVGMGGDEGFPVDPDRLRPGQIAVDLVYEPRATPWLRALRARGVEAHNGLSMLVHQAAVAFEHWTGERAPVPVMRAAVLERLGG